MSSYCLRAEAEGDLQEIADYTFDTFGLAQAETYGQGLRSCFDTIADNPRIGRDFGHVKSGVRRYEYQSHSVYYDHRRGHSHFAGSGQPHEPRMASLERTYPITNGVPPLN